MADVYEIAQDPRLDEDGGMTISLNEEEEVSVDTSIHEANLVLGLGDMELSAIAADVYKAVEDDIASRSDWEDILVKGLAELGLRIEETDDPFEGACTAVHPLLIENAVKFQSKAIHELFPAQGPVKIREDAIPNDAEILKIANAAKVFLNFQLLDEMEEYYDDTERLLFHLAVVGSAFRKTYWDGALRRPVSEFVPVDQFIVGYNTADLRRARRYTHIIFRTQEEYESDVAAGIYDSVDLGIPGSVEMGKVAREIDRLRGISQPVSYQAHTFYEHHCYMKLAIDGDQLRPYIVTIDKGLQKVLSIYRNWDPEDPKMEKIEFFTHYVFVPGVGFYGLGLTHLIGSLSKSASSTLRVLVDAGMFATLQGGFKARGLRIVGGNDPIAPGEFRDVEAVGLDISKAILPLPFKEPSQTLYKLLEFIVMSGQKFADSTEQVISEATNYGPVGTTMALLEASTRFFSAIHKRIHNSFKRELKKIVRLDRLYHQRPEIQAIFSNEQVQIVPCSDPNTPSNAHRLTRIQTILQMAEKAPQIYNTAELHKQALVAMGINDPERFIPPPPQPQPADPLSDIMTASQGQPIKAFPGQDHDSHVTVKMAFLGSQAGGANPAMAQVAPLLAANIREHLVLRFVEKVQALGGNTEQAMAIAAQQVASLDIAQAQAMAGQTQDPTLDLGYKELEQRKKEHEDDQIIKVAELAVRNKEVDSRIMKQEQDNFAKGAQISQKDKSDTTKVAMKAKTDMEKIASQERIAQKQAQVQSQANKDKAAKDFAETRIKHAAQQADARDKETPKD